MSGAELGGLICDGKRVTCVHNEVDKDNIVGMLGTDISL